MIYLLSYHPVTSAKLEYWRLNLPTLRVVATLEEVPPTAILIAKIPYQPSTLWFWRTLSRRPGPYGLHRVQCLPELPSWRTWMKFAINPAWLGIRPATFVICAGTAGTVHPLIGPQTEQIHTISPDWWRRAAPSPELGHTAPYAVFLDEGENGSHPDYDTLGLTRIDAWRYRFEMQLLFEQVTRETGLMIRTAYREDGLTPALVAGASLVLTHSSTAVSFAIWAQKPVRVLIPPCFHGRPNERNAQAMALALKDYGNYERQYLNATA